MKTPIPTDLNPDLYYIVKSFADDQRLNDAVNDELDGQVGMIAEAMSLAARFLNMCDEHVDFAAYGEGCFPYEMETNFFNAYNEVRCGGRKRALLIDGTFPLTDETFLEMCKILKLPLKDRYCYQIVEWDADGPGVVSIRFNTLEAAQARVKAGDFRGMGSLTISKYRVLPDDLVKHVQDYLLDGTPVTICLPQNPPSDNPVTVNTRPE